MAVSGKGKGVVVSKAAAAKRKRPLSASVGQAEAAGCSSARRGKSGVKKRSRRASASLFIDDAAVDADDWDDSDEEEEEEEEDDFAEEEDELISDIQVGAKESKGAGKSTMPLFLKEEDLSGEGLEEYFNKQFDQGSDDVMYDEDDKEVDDRKSGLHSTDDPIIWKVRCMVGHERHLAFCLLQKCVSLNVRGSKLPLISVFALEHVKGYVYMEAEKQHDIFEACKGFCALYAHRISRVPTKEVPRLFSVQHKPNEIAEGAWVRMKNGKYKGDLAQVMSFDAKDKKATVKLVPRIDFQALAKKFGGGISLRHAAIPAPRLISSRELEDFRPHIETRLDHVTGELFEILDGLMLKDGYLYKKVPILSLNCFGVQPSSVELMKFEPAKRDEPQLSDYISTLYGGRKGNSSQTLDGTLEDNESSIKLHDLVLFGRKDFGVIIGMKCGIFQILKGGVEEQLVVAVQRREIKKSCIDKMFTASDSQKKTICINDSVKVLAGPQKDRQGIVKHMYKGTLFVYDEDIQKDTGFFCVKCESCEVMKGHKSYHFGSKGSAEYSSMPLSPTKCSEQRDFSNGFKKYGQGDGDQPFTIGQTLRIRVGPLKGHLCRVVRIYRSDVTVKLDSLVKIITVNSNHLSVPNIKNFGNARDDTMSTQCLSKDEPVDGDIGEPSSKSKWDFELPSSTRVSLPGLSSWGGSSSNCDDNKASNDRGDDPWGSKIISGNGCQAGHSGSGEEQVSQPTDVWNNWTKAEKSTEGNDQREDRWGSKVPVGNVCQIEHSGNAEEQSSQPADGWSNWTKPKTPSEGNDQGDPWGSKVALRNGCQTGLSANAEEQSSRPADGCSNWTKAERSTEGNNQGVDQWGSKIALGNGCQTGHSGNAELQFQPRDGWSSWTKVERTTEGEHESWKGNSKNEGEKSDGNRPLCSTHDQADSWNKGGSGRCDDKGDWEGHTDRSRGLENGKQSGNAWTKAATDGWGNLDKAKSIEDEHKSWKSTNEGEASGWNKAAASNNVQSDNWSRGASILGEYDGKSKTVSAWGSHNDRPESSEGGQGFGSSWGKADKGNITNKCETDAWSKAVPSSCGHTDNWESWSKGSSDFGPSDGKVHLERNMDKSGHFEVGQGSGTSWDKATMIGQGNWNKAEKSIEGDSKSWKANDTNEGESDGWNKAKLYNHDQEDRWNKGNCVSGGNRGTFGDDGHQGGGWSRRPDSGGEYGSSWGRGRSRNCETYGSGDKPDSWNRSRDSDSQQARGRGSGFNGRGCGRSQDDSWKGSCSDAGWSSSRGRGRGGRGRGSWEGRGRRDNYNGSSHSGHDGDGPSFGWKNDQGSSGKGGFSGDALSSWKNNQGNNWNGQNQLAGNHPSGLSSCSAGDGVRSDDQSGDWSGGKSFSGDRSFGLGGNMSSGRGYGRGRGRGRCFGQEQASGWRGGMCSNEEAGGDDAKKGTGGEETWGQKAKGTCSSWDSGADNRAGGSGTHSDWNNSSSPGGWTSCREELETGCRKTDANPVSHRPRQGISISLQAEVQNEFSKLEKEIKQEKTPAGVISTENRLGQVDTENNIVEGNRERELHVDVLTLPIKTEDAVLNSILYRETDGQEGTILHLSSTDVFPQSSPAVAGVECPVDSPLIEQVSYTVDSFPLNVSEKDSPQVLATVSEEMHQAEVKQTVSDILDLKSCDSAGILGKPHGDSNSKNDYSSDSMTPSVAGLKLSGKLDLINLSEKTQSQQTKEAEKQLGKVHELTPKENLTGGKVCQRPVPKMFSNQKGPSTRTFKKPPSLSTRHNKWYRTDNPPVSSLSEQVKWPGHRSFSRQSPKKLGKIHSSYVRKGNSLIRKSSPAIPSCHPHPEQTAMDQIHLPETNKNVSVENKIVSADSLNFSGARTVNSSFERPKTPPLPLSSKSTHPSLGSLQTLMEVPLSEPCGEDNVIPLVGTQGSDVNEENHSIVSTEESKVSGKKKLIYVKHRSNQLVAASAVDASNTSVHTTEESPALPCAPPDIYYRNKNKLIRDTSLSDGQAKQEISLLNGNSGGKSHGPSKMPSLKNGAEVPRKTRLERAMEKTYKHSRFSLVWTLNGSHLQNSKQSNILKHRKVLPYLFPWKRTYRRDFVTKRGSKHSPSSIRSKLQLFKQRHTIYTISKSGFSLRKSGVLGVSGSNLKWSKSMERRSRKANEEAAVARMEHERKKKKLKGTTNADLTMKSENCSRRKLALDIQLHQGERIFRVGTVHYKMDSSRRTLVRIPDEQAPSITNSQLVHGAKMSIVPRRLSIGNDEYVRIGNGNKLVRDPKKLVRILANEKIRWSLHTARLRSVRKQQYCQFFTRFGKCNKEDGKCPYIHDPTKIAICTKFLKGLCSSPNCKLTHKIIPERMPDCSYFLQGLCTNMSCPYRHVKVNANASVCEGFLKGYCRDGDECRKKHSYVCPYFEASGECHQRATCKLHHPKHASKQTCKSRKGKRIPIHDHGRGRYFGGSVAEAGESHVSALRRDTQEKDGDIFCQEGRFTEYISLDVATDDDDVEHNDLMDSRTMFVNSDLSDSESSDIDALIKPIRIMNMD